MNKQAKTNGGRGIEWTDYTWNPIKGCFHACQWAMPDGTIANCYAEDMAGKFRTAYPQGFEHHYWNPVALKEPARVKTPSRVFVGSMADVFGHWVPEEQIRAVLDVCRAADWHTFQFLTKNPRRVRQFLDALPPNVWIGASTPPDFMWNKPLTQAQKERLFDATLSELAFLKVNGVTTWISAEPLSWDVSVPLAMKAMPYTPFLTPSTPDELPIRWIVIGAASNGPKYFPPDADDVRRLLVVLDRYNVPVFFKGNLKSLPQAADNWREEFPESGVAHA